MKGTIAMNTTENTASKPKYVKDDIEGAASKPKDVNDDIEGTASNPKDVNDDVEGLISTSDDDDGWELVEYEVEAYERVCDHPRRVCDFRGSNQHRWRYTCRCCGTFWSGPKGSLRIPAGPGQRGPQLMA